MDTREIEFILASSARHVLRERIPEPFDDPYSAMTSEEKSRLLMLQQRMYDEAVRRADEAARRADEAEARSAELLSKVGELLAGQGRMHSDMSSMVRRLAEKDRLIEELRKMIADKEDDLALLNRWKGSGRKKSHNDG